LRSPRSCPPPRSRDGERAGRAQTRAGEGGPPDHLVSAAGHVEDTDHTERYRVVERSGRAWRERKPENAHSHGRGEPEIADKEPTTAQHGGHHSDQPGPGEISPSRVDVRRPRSSDVDNG